MRRGLTAAGLAAAVIVALQGLVAAGPDAALVADETHNTIERVSGLRPCL